MFVAGLFAGAGFLVKQSGYDGGLAAGLWLAARGLARLAARPGRRCARSGRWRSASPLIIGARGAARRADRLPRLVVRGRRLPPLGRERRHRLGLGARLAVHRLAAHRRARGGRARRCSRSRASGSPCSGRESVLLALWFVLSLTGFAIGGPLPRPLLRRAADAAVRARGAHDRGLPGACRPRGRPGGARPAGLQGLAVLHRGRHARALARLELGLAHRHATAPSAATCTRTRGPDDTHLRALRRRRPVPRRRPALALSVPLVPRHRAHPGRAAAAARHARRPATRRATSPSTSSRETIDKQGDIGRTLRTRYRHVATIDGVPIWRLRGSGSAAS